MEEKKTKICPYCGEEIMASAIKCRYCGKWLGGDNEHMMPCPVCGEMIDKSAEFCPYSKEPLGKYRTSLVTTTSGINGAHSDNQDAVSQNTTVEDNSKTSRVYPQANNQSASNVRFIRSGSSMNMMDAVKRCYNKWAIYEGRASKSEYWYFFLFGVIVAIALGIIGLCLFLVLGFTKGALIANVVLLFAGSLLVGLPSFSAGIRRLHDAGYSGWCWFTVFIPFAGYFILLYFLVKDSDNDNKYGLRPDNNTSDDAPTIITQRDKLIVAALCLFTVLEFVGFAAYSRFMMNELGLSNMEELWVSCKSPWLTQTSDQPNILPTYT